MTGAAATIVARLAARDGRPVFHIRREGDLLVAEWAGMGVLRAREDATWSEFVPAPGIDPRRAEKLREGAVRALVGHLRGQPSLHASSVALGGAAIACVGDPGAGKSTAAADLCQRRGAELVADDVTSLALREDGIDVLPSRESHWLLPESRAAIGIAGDADARAAKTPLSPRAATRERVPLSAIVALVFDDGAREPALEPVRGARRFAVLHASAFRFRVDAPDANLRDFDQLAEIAERVPVLALRRARSLADLARAGDRLATLLLEGR